MKTGKISLIFFLLVFFAISGCKKSHNDGTDSKTFRFNESIVIDGLTRTYIVNLPPDYYQSNSFPLVIALHGGGGSGSQFESQTGLTDKANAAHFIVVYPDGYLGPLNNRSWNAGGCCGAAENENVNDIKFISELIDKLTGNYKINSKLIYVTGHSNGGMLSYRLASELSGNIAAIAVNSCSMVVTSAIHPSRPVPVLHMHSKLDTKVPFAGGIGITGAYFPPVDSVLTVWAGINACNNTPHNISYTGYDFSEWTNCTGNTIIQLYLTNDGGHAWPGGHSDNPDADASSTAINADNLLWDFFRQYQLP